MKERDGGKQGEAEDAGRKGARAKKRSRGEKASKKCSNMAKGAQIASLAISRGGAKRLYLRRAEHLEQRSIAPRRRRRRRRRRRKGGIERPEEDADGMEKTKEDGDEDGRERVRARL